MDYVKARAIRDRFVRRFSDLRLFEVKMIRVNAWQKSTPAYFERESMTVGRIPATRDARRYWTAHAVDHSRG